MTDAPATLTQLTAHTLTDGCPSLAPVPENSLHLDDHLQPAPDAGDCSTVTAMS